MTVTPMSVGAPGRSARDRNPDRSGTFFSSRWICRRDGDGRQRKARGALVSTGGDLVRWQIALTGGRAVSPVSYQEMITSTVTTGQGTTRYGFGLMVNESNGQKVISHTGGIPGFNSILTTLPNDDIHVAVIWNSTALTSQVFASFIVAGMISAEPPELPEQRFAASPGTEKAVRRMLDEQ
jgi:D-alanyl-D-alanine carboxypeptidase